MVQRLELQQQQNKMPISHIAVIFVLVFTTVQNAPTNSGARAAYQRCSAPKVRAGETAVMTFFFRQEINASSDINFVTMTRASAPDHDILICDRKSPLVCKPTSNLYQTDSSIDRNRITLRIPNVTRAFEDRYFLKMYVNDQAEPTDVCYLHVQEEPTCPSGTWKCRNGTCISVYWRCDTRNDCGDNSDEQHCGEWVCPVGQWKCRDNVCISSSQRCDNRNDCSDDSDEENCDVNDVPADTTGGNDIFGQVDFFIVNTVVLMIIAICLGIIVFCQAPSNCLLLSCRQRNEAQVDGHDESAMPFLPSLRFNDANKGNGHECKRWFYETLLDEEENQLLKSERNEPGSFLVKVSPNCPRNYILKVLLKNGIKYLTLVPQKQRLLCPSTGKSCGSLCEFVDYYRKHDIKVKNTVWGRLTKPFEREPSSEWYFGRMTDDQAKTILQRNGPGSFLVRVCCHDEDGYDLCLNNDGQVHFFGIIPEDDGFMMLDIQRLFRSVETVVHYFTYNELYTGENLHYGKLCKPCKRDSEDNA